MNECRVSVRDVRGSAPHRRSDASLTHCPVEDSEMCPEMRLAGRDVPRKIYTIRIWRSLEHRKCPRFAPRARNSPRVPEIRVACPRFALQRHRVMTNLPTFFLSLSSLEIPSFFWNPHRDIIYIIYFTFLTPPCISASVILDSGTFSDISDVLAFAKFDLCIFLVYECRKSSTFCLRV